MREPEREPDQESAVRDHVDGSRTGGQGTHFDSKMTVVGRVEDGPVPTPHGPLMQSDLLEMWGAARRDLGDRILVGQDRQQGFMERHRFGEEFEDARLHPAGSKGDSGLVVPIACASVIHGLLEESDSRLLPQRTAEKGGRVSRGGEHRSCRDLDGVVDGREALG